ncbi:MAG: zinc ribbon domain-containing protein [Sedimentisphaerales bacterium]|nr:zinc ribbon domain-containing protein [Sedimentisphaerales bacterium]
MPIFEYKCRDCGKISEFLESSSSTAKRACEHCGGGKLDKQFSTFAPRVKEGESKKCHGCSDNSCPHAGRN